VNAGEDQCFWTRTPTLSRDGESVLLYYTDASSGTSELYQKQLGSELAPALVTMDPMGVNDIEKHIAAAPFGSSDLIAYVNAKPTIGSAPDLCDIVTRRPGLGDEQSIITQEQGWFISDLSLLAFPADHDLGGVLSYIADHGDGTSAMYAQLLDKGGQASGERFELSDKVGAFSNIAGITIPAGADPAVMGALVYTIGPDDLHSELRFRPINNDGTLGEERKLTSGNRNAQGIGIAEFGGGYAIAYRLIEGPNTSMVMNFVSYRGDVVPSGLRFITEADTSGSPPELFVTADGRITLVFANHNGDGMFLRAVRAICDG
jgi:hypothetical protein